MPDDFVKNFWSLGSGDYGEEEPDNFVDEFWKLGKNEVGYGPYAGGIGRPDLPPAVEPWNLREDKTVKGPGWLGALKTPDGKTATELSIGVGFDGKEELIPSLVPTLTPEERDHLISGGEPTEEIIQKAVAHAKKMWQSGRSPFATAADSQQLPPQPPPTPAPEQLNPEYMAQDVPSAIAPPSMLNKLDEEGVDPQSPYYQIIKSADYFVNPESHAGYLYGKALQREREMFNKFGEEGYKDYKEAVASGKVIEDKSPPNLVHRVANTLGGYANVRAGQAVDVVGDFVQRMRNSLKRAAKTPGEKPEETGDRISSNENVILELGHKMQGVGENLIAAGMKPGLAQKVVAGIGSAFVDVPILIGTRNFLKNFNAEQLTFALVNAMHAKAEGGSPEDIAKAITRGYVDQWVFSGAHGAASWKYPHSTLAQRTAAGIGGASTAALSGEDAEGVLASGITMFGLPPSKPPKPMTDRRVYRMAAEADRASRIAQERAMERPAESTELVPPGQAGAVPPVQTKFGPLVHEGAPPTTEKMHTLGPEAAREMWRKRKPEERTYYKSERLIKDKMPNRMRIEDFKNFLKKNGIKDEEIRDLGLDKLAVGNDILTGIEKTFGTKETSGGGRSEAFVNKQDVIDAIETNKIDVIETEPTNGQAFAQYMIPGGSNYREILFKQRGGTYGTTKPEHYQDDVGVFAYTRVADFRTPDGKRDLHIGEIQSDAPWHAPMRENYPRYALRRMMQYAAENGYDTISWTLGENLADMYTKPGGPLIPREKLEKIDKGMRKFYDERMRFVGKKEAGKSGGGPRVGTVINADEFSPGERTGRVSELMKAKRNTERLLKNTDPADELGAGMLKNELKELDNVINEISSTTNEHTVHMMDVKPKMAEPFSMYTAGPKAFKESLERSKAAAERDEKVSRFRSVTMKKLYTPEELAKMPEENYKYAIQHNEDTLRVANEKVKNDLPGAIDELMSKPSPELNGYDGALEVMVMREMSRPDQRHISEKDAGNMAEFTVKFANRHTMAGQYNQALALADRFSPERILMTAVTELKRAGHELQDKMIRGKKGSFEKLIGRKIDNIGELIKPDKAKKLIDLAKKIDGLPEGYRKDYLQAMAIREIRDVLPVPKIVKVDTLQTMAMLINFKTWLRNVVGNTGFAALDVASQATFGAGLDWILSRITGQRTIARWTPKQMFAYLREFGNKWRMASAENKVGVNTSGFEIERLLGKRGKEVMERHFGGAPGNVSGKYTIQGRVFKPGSFLNTLEKMLGFELVVPDRAAMGATYAESLNNMLRASGLKNPTQEMVAMATYEGMLRTFQDNNAMAKMFSEVKSALNAHKAWGFGSLLVKFPRIPATLMKLGIKDLTPIGVVAGVGDIINVIGKAKALRHNAPVMRRSPEGQAELGRQANELFIKQRAGVSKTARGIVGSLVGAGGWPLMKLPLSMMWLAATGIATGAEPENNKLADYESAIGKRPYSINLSALFRKMTGGLKSFVDTSRVEWKNGDDIVSYDWIQPMANGWGAVVDLYNGLSGEKDVSALGFAEGIFTMLETSINVAAEQPFLTGLKRFMNRRTGRSFINTIMSVPASFVPSLAAHGRYFVDPVLRQRNDAETRRVDAIASIMDRIPYLSKLLDKRKDVLGEDRVIYQSSAGRFFDALNAFATPFIIEKYSASPEMETVLKLSYETGETGALPRNLWKTVRTIPYGGGYVLLTPEEREKMQKLFGERYSEMIEREMKDDYVKEMKPEKQVEHIYSQITKIVRELKLHMKSDVIGYENIDKRVMTKEQIKNLN